MNCRSALLLAMLISFAAHSGEPDKTTKPAPKVPVRKKLDKLAAEMDYGPFLSVSLGEGFGPNIAFKGIIVKVNKEKNASICFDTELLRVSQAWIGTGLSLAGRPFADDSNDYPIVEGPLAFKTNVRPGWSKDGERADPRGPKDPNAPKDGPLPGDWAKYKGLYINGEKVVFSYTVGGVPVLELDGAQVFGEQVAFTRTLNIPATDKPLEIFVCELDKSEITSGSVGEVSPAVSKEKNGADALMATLTTKETALGAGVVGAPKGAEWEVSEGRVYFKLPKLDAPVALKILISRLSLDKLKTFGDFLTGAPEDLAPLTKGGSAHWTEPVVTKGEVSADATAPYVIDTLTAPMQNPYHSWLRFTALDFFKDGRAAVTTWNGDVWIVSGIDEKLEKLSWKRFATGLAGPMGLKIVDDVVYVNARDQITRLIDLNGDGEADFYENFNNDTYLTTNFHEYCFDLQTDKEGNWYFTKGSAIWAGSLRMSDHAGTFIKLSKDGTKFEVLANGFRAPNGCAVGPNGELTCSDNQGNWTPLCPINFIRKGAYYGWVGAGQTAKPEREKPLVWIPYNIDKSTSGQVWVDGDKWGPFKGHMFAFSYACVATHIIFDHIGDDVQGGAVKLPWTFQSGIMRARFHPVDGQLYAAGLRGWSSVGATKDCILQRVRYTGKPLHVILDAKMTKAGMDVTFTGTLDKDSAIDLQNISAEWCNVVRTGNYGSGDFAVSDPKKKGREPVEIKSAKLSPDGKTISLEIPGLKPVANFILKFKLKAADGAVVNQELDYTINKVP